MSTGGNITLGGNFTGTKGAGLYAASGRTGGAPGILISNATITAAGGNINIYGRCTTSYDDGIRLQATITTTGSGTIGIYGDSHGGLLDASADVFFGGITFITAASTIETDAGNINIEATLTNTQSNGTYALNFYRTVYTTGTQDRHIQLLSRSGNIQVTGDRGVTSAGGMGSSSWGDIYAGSPLSASWTASGNITFSYSSFVGAGQNGIITKTTGAVTYEPVSTSFSAAQTFPYNANYTLASSASSLTIGKPGNTANITIASAQTVAGPVSIYGGTVALTGAVTATGSTLTLGAATALTQTGAVSASSLLLSGAGTFTLSNTSNNVASIAGGTSGSRLGSLNFTDASGGLTIGTVGGTSGIYTTGALLVETLTGDINLTESVSSSATTSTALTINAGKSSAIGTNAGGNILVSGTPTVSVGSAGIGRLFSGLETNSTGLTTLAGGSGNVRYGFDETTTTFSPVLAGSTIHAIYRTNTGTGDLTIVASTGDAINTTWSFDNGTLTTTNATVNVNASVIQDYLNSGALTIDAGNVTISSAITSSAANAFVINSNGVKTITVNAAVSLGGAATFHSNAFALGSGINISTSTASDITINANADFSTTSTTRRTISSAGGDIIIHADKDRNGSGVLDLDYLTINPGAGNIIIRGETVNFLAGSGQMPYINGTGSFTFESSDASFGSSPIYTSWFFIDQDADGISGLTIGKPDNTANIEINTNISIGGPVSLYGGYVNINGNLTSSETGDIFIKGIAGTNPSIWIQSGKSITKSGGTGTLTLQGHGRVTHQGSITTSGTGVMNVIFWSDFDNDNDDGGVSQQGTISTNGGHVWLGGSSSNGGSYTWNGLTVGDGPSIGSTGFNGNAMDIYGNITTNGGDFLAWAGSTVSSGGIAGIANDGSGDIVSVGSGDIVLITDMVYGSAGAALFFTQSGGTFTLVPHDGSFRSTFNWNPAIQTYIGSTADDYNLQAGDFDWLGIGEFNSIARLTIGYYNGMLSNGTPVEFTNSSNITFSTATTSAGAFNLYGGAIAMNNSLTTTSATNGNIVLNGTTVSGTGNLAVAAGRTATISVSSASTYDGIVSGSTSGLTKSGAGLLTLTKDHTYTGATTISGGDLQVGSGGSVSQASSGTISNTTGVAVSNGSKLVLSPNENITFAVPVAGDGGVEVKGASGLYRSTALTTTASLIASNVSVLEVLTRITGGTFTGSAGSGNCGAYQKSYNAATNTATLQFQQFVSPYTKVVFVTLERINTTDVAIKGTGAAYRSGDYLGQNMATIGGTTAYTFPTNYGISQVFMSGKVNFTGALTYTGTTTLSNTTTSATSPTTYSYISKGTQEITDASSSFPSAIVNNGLVILNRTTPLTIAGDMSGTEDILQVGAEVTLTGTNTHTGTTTIDLNKTLNIGSGGSTGSMMGNIVNYGALTFNRTGSSSYPGVISGSGTVTKSGAGDLTMNNLITYTGATTINGGTLILERDVPTSSSSGFSGAGALTIQPSSASFTSAVTWPIPGFPAVSSGLGGLTLGKSGNTANITFSTSATSIAGPITVYGGTIALDQNITSTAAGDISLHSDAALGGLTSTRTITTTGTFKYMPQSTSFSSAVNFPISNLSLTNITGLQLGKSGNTANLNFVGDVSVPGPITVYAGPVSLAANLTTTGSGDISIYSDASLTATGSRTATAAGLFKYMPDGTSFSSAVSFPIGNLTVSSTGLQLGKPGNTAAMTITGNASSNGPVTVHTGDFTTNAGSVLTATGSALVVHTSGNVTLNEALAGSTTTINGQGNVKTIGSLTNLNLSGTNAQDITGTATLTNLTLNKSAGTATLTAGRQNLTGTLTLTAGTLAAGGYLTLKSSATGTARVTEHATSTGNVTGNVVVERFVPGSRRMQWRMLAFPYNAPLTLSSITGIKINYSAPQTMMYFRENLDNGVYGSGGTRNGGYQTFSSSGQTISVGQGVAAWVYGDENTSATPGTGTLGAGGITISSLGELNETGADISIPVTNTAAGWNLVGNPFASTIDWDLVRAASSNLNATLYRWDPQAEQWTNYNSSGGTTGKGSRFIESGSAFFVKAAGSGAMTLTIPQSAKITTAEDLHFSKNPFRLDIPGQRVRKPSTLAGLRMKASGMGNPIPGEAYLDVSKTDATKGWDPQYDGLMMSRSSGANVYFDGEKDNDFSMHFDAPLMNGEQRYYPITVTTPKSGETLIEVSSEGNWSSMHSVSLIDKQLGRTILMRNGLLSYKIRLEELKSEGRFLLAINHVKMSADGQLPVFEAKALGNPVTGNVIDLQLTHPTAAPKRWRVVDAMGREAGAGLFATDAGIQHRLTVPGMRNPGVYVLQVEMDNGETQQVRILKN